MANPFLWNDGTPSVLANDRVARGVKGGRSFSQVAAQTVRTKERKTGRSPGSIYGISAKADAAIHPRRGKR